MKAYYFGCWRTAGHDFFRPGPSRIYWSVDPPTPWGPGYKIDGTLTPKDRRQGAAALRHHVEGWTALSVHDYTVDHRGGSHSTFCFDAILDFDGAMAAAREHFPEVVERIGPITQVE